MARAPRSQAQKKADPRPDEATLAAFAEKLGKSTKREATTKEELGQNDAFRDSDDIGFAVGRLINQGQVADGPSLPRPVHGEFRVPMVSGLRVLSGPTAGQAGSLFTLAWYNCTDPYVSRYQIYVRNALDTNVQPLLIGVTQGSPYVALVLASAAVTAIFYVQTVMNNGQALPIDRCPTCTAITLDPTVGPTFIADGSLTIAKFAAAPRSSLITFDATNTPKYLAPGPSGTVLTSNGASGDIAWQSTKRLRTFGVSRPTTISGSLAYGTLDNCLVYQLDPTTGTKINVWFRVPEDVDPASAMILALSCAAHQPPGTTANKVNLLTTARVGNTSAAETAGDIITLPNSSDWVSYIGVNNRILGSTYAAGSMVQLAIRRETAVANNASVALDISVIQIIYTSLA